MPANEIETMLDSRSAALSFGFGKSEPFAGLAGAAELQEGAS